jgi:hypothetical protein
MDTTDLPALREAVAETVTYVETVVTAHEKRTVTHTFDELLDIFGDDDNVVVPLVRKIRAISVALPALLDEVERLRKYVEADKDAHCLPTCDTYGHDAKCPYVDAVEHFAQVKADLASARAVLDSVSIPAPGPEGPGDWPEMSCSMNRAAWEAYRKENRR